MQDFPNRHILTVTGEDAASFLQRVITTDIEHLCQKKAKPGALLSPQGKILVDFMISKKEKQLFFLETADTLSDLFLQKLLFYRLRAKVNIEKSLQTRLYILNNQNPEALESNLDAFYDTRFKDLSILRVYSSREELSLHPITSHRWIDLRIEYGIVESPLDFVSGTLFPHDIGLHRFDGIKLSKGCYIGQEVVARMHHQATLKKDIFIVLANDPLPISGGDILYGNKIIGKLGSIAQNRALCCIKKEYVQQNLPETYSVAGKEVFLISPYAGNIQKETD